MAKLWDNLACEPFDPGAWRLGVDERITARVVRITEGTPEVLRWRMAQRLIRNHK